jgi:hypothetical protein
MTMRAWLFMALMAGCSNSPGPEPDHRTYRLGFASNPPRLTIESVLQTLEAWRPHADIAQITYSVPFRALLADTSARALVNKELKDLVVYYKSRGWPVAIELDATDGLAREKEAPELVALGRSISETAVQAVYREYVLAVDSILRPDYLALAMETNLVRAIAPASVYAPLRTMVNAAAAALQQHNSTARTFVTVQVETAWGRLPAGPFVGIAQDIADFPFMQAIGLSSYPFLAGFAEPEDVPLDYYSRIGSAAPALPMLVLEGGWTSASVSGFVPGTQITSSPEKQARYIRRQMEIADRANVVAITQITFSDFDMSTYPVPPGSILPLFAHLGLVDVNLAPKPALAEWDRALARPLRD